MPTSLIAARRKVGRSGAQIAHQIGIAERTVKVHRGNVMKKMGATSLAELVRMADKLGLT
ncbi:MAG TPA: LuxR C-terminal-related transcriptional regulator [Afifellaceae bacterium]|nr:LuxR C-terminal-related transcriptional regulator [Afifellaceae bacterium]